MRRFAFSVALFLGSCPLFAQKNEITLPTTKSISTSAPGAPQRLNTYPLEMAVSPDGRYVAILNNGYGSPESKLNQSIAVLNVATSEIADFPDERFSQESEQDYFVGMVFSLDGNHLYASVASETDPEGRGHNSVGNGIAVYRFADGKLAPEKFIHLPQVELSKDQKVGYGARGVRKGYANPYPAGLAITKRDGRELLVVAENLADGVALVDPQSGRVIAQFDVRRRRGIVPARFPYRVIAAPDGNTAWCALWNDSTVVQLDLHEKKEGAGKVLRTIKLDRNEKDETGSHPNALAMTPDGKYLFVALATRDAVAVIDAEKAQILGQISTQLPGQKYEGVYPDALAVSEDGKSLFVADAAADAVVQYALPARISANALPVAKAYIPTEWYPTALKVIAGDLLIAAGKGKGSGPNNGSVDPKLSNEKHRYIAWLMNGSLARLPLASISQQADAFKNEVLQENRLNGRSDSIAFASGKNPIKHVIYIIKENRTYDQILGDLKVGDGDHTLTEFGADITPNEHALALQFGVLDNFYDSGEVSGNGHVWSTSATSTEYTELAWQVGYRNSQREYDFEGKVGDIYPVEEDEDDINEPGTGYLWTNAARHHISYRHYGEYIDTQWCEADTANLPPSTGASTAHCAKTEIKPGELLPANVGDPKGGPNPYPWPVPVIARNVATKRELRDHFDPSFADFRIDYPDQLRADEFLNEFDHFVKARNSGMGEQLPNLIVLRLPNDHTAGTRTGMPTPDASVADNDLAVGRVVEAVSHSPYWDDTAIFILEDDAQAGTDHVDAHRSIALVISKYSPRQNAPFIDHHFYTTVNVIRTMESLLGLPPMNHNDGQAALMSPLFSGDGSQPPYKADSRNRDNKLIYQANQPNAPGASQSAQMDFSKADRANAQELNAILWRVTKGDTPMPEPRFTVPLR